MSIEDAYIELRKTNQLRQETITKLSKENAKLKENLEKIKEVINECMKFKMCKSCKFYKECNKSMEEYILKIIEGTEDE